MEAATRVTGTHKEKRKQKRGKRRNLLSPERRKREREESDTVVLLQSKENASLEHCQQHLLIARPRAGTKSYYIISRTKNEPLPESSFHPTLLAFESLLGLGRRNRWLIGPPLGSPAVRLKKKRMKPMIQHMKLLLLLRCVFSERIFGTNSPLLSKRNWPFPIRPACRDSGNSHERNSQNSVAISPIALPKISRIKSLLQAWSFRTKDTPIPHEPRVFTFTTDPPRP